MMKRRDHNTYYLPAVRHYLYNPDEYLDINKIYVYVNSELHDESVLARDMYSHEQINDIAEKIIELHDGYKSVWEGLKRDRTLREEYSSKKKLNRKFHGMFAYYFTVLSKQFEKEYQASKKDIGILADDMAEMEYTLLNELRQDMHTYLFGTESKETSPWLNSIHPMSYKPLPELENEDEDG